MAENHIRGKGTPRGYKFGAGNQTPSNPGPFVGIVKNNIDPTRAARLQVYIEQFSGPDETDPSNWRTVAYLPPFFGSTEHSGTAVGSGNYVGNKHSYGMWFTPPDIGTRVLCFFVAGDPNNGYYVGCIPEDSLNHMVPAIGASKNYLTGSDGAKKYISGASQVPVTEINNLDPTINEDPKFYNKPKPIHEGLAKSLFDQGIIKDNIRGPITSTAQRESPSNVFGLSTPGKPIYNGVAGADQNKIRQKLQSGELSTDKVKVVGRKGGHSIVLDDGDLDGENQLVRIRTAKGHQITMSDDGDAFYILHANGQTWLEFGKEGTVDIFSTNSINMRSQGTVNIHADKDINMYAGGKFNAYSKLSTTIESQTELGLTGIQKATVYSKQFAGIRSDATAAFDAGTVGSIDGGAKLDIKGGIIGLNSGGGIPVSPVTLLKKNKVADTNFTDAGWQAEYGKLETISTRVPTHEPWPYHNLGVENSVDVGGSKSSLLPTAVANKVTALAGISPSNPITASNFASQLVASKGIGSLDQDQLTGMLAQKANDVGQEFGDITSLKGVGKYGISAEQLETAGYIKPGSVSKFLKDPSQLENTLKDANIWTGKAGADSLTSFLTDKAKQTLAQEDILSANLSTLKAKGIVTGTEASSELGAILQASSTHGTDAVSDWVKGAGNVSINNEINQVARNAQYAVKLVDNKLSELSKSYSNPGAFSGTTVRKALDDAIDSILSDTRASSPKTTRT